MAGISASGLGSGLDVNSIISQLMALEQQPLKALATKEAGFQAKISSFGMLKGALASLQTAAKTLTTVGTFTGMSASVSDSTVLTASAGSTAAAGNYNLSVTQLAKFHALRSNTDYAATTDTFTTGTLSISIGSGTPKDITIDATNNTLAGIRQAINDADAGVTAAIINDGTTNRLVLTSTTSGSAGAITVAVTPDPLSPPATHALSGLASASLVPTQTADDAKLTINGIEITRSSNTITDAIEGVTLSLAKGTLATPGTTTLSVAKNTGATAAAIGAFVKAYNDAVTQLKNSSAYDATNKKASTLTGDSTVRSIQSQLNGLVQSSLTGIAGGIGRLSDIGVTVQANGTLAVDNTKLNAALADREKDVGALFTQTTTGNIGIAVRFNAALEAMVGTGGLISSRTDGISASVKDLGKRREALTMRLANIEKRYRTQFTALDSLISGMNKTSQFLTQQLANLPGASSNR
ncbi:MAG: flagellar filament capping protein FliD [Rhodocyclaceae bacterium]|nr:flagellar filament capping protein FliD [Rhodocyclaceae bacterium]